MDFSILRVSIKVDLIFFCAFLKLSIFYNSLETCFSFCAQLIRVISKLLWGVMSSANICNFEKARWSWNMNQVVAFFLPRCGKYKNLYFSYVFFFKPNTFKSLKQSLQNSSTSVTFQWLQFCKIVVFKNTQCGITMVRRPDRPKVMTRIHIWNPWRTTRILSSVDSIDSYCAKPTTAKWNPLVGRLLSCKLYNSPFRVLFVEF